MSADLKQQMLDHIEGEMSNLTYEILAELSVLYALKMDDAYKKMFFEKVRHKFIKELQYLKDETLYKILWSFFKAGQLKVDERNPEWQGIKETLVKRSKEISPKVMADLLVLATLEGSKQDGGPNSNDLFS